MHPYSINSEDRHKVFWIIVPLSLLGGWGINQYVLKSLEWYQSYSWIVDIPSSSLPLLGILYGAFDKYLWKIFSKTGILFSTPILDGYYEGVLHSSRDNRSTPVEIKIKIDQTLSSIRVCLSTHQSSSRSEMATILVNEPDGPLLIYEFLNDHRKVFEPGLTIHRGLARLTYNRKHNQLTGTYYTSPERGNYGEIRAWKVENQRSVSTSYPPNTAHQTCLEEAL